MPFDCRRFGPCTNSLRLILMPCNCSHAKLADKSPQVVFTATTAFFDASPVPFDPIAKLGGSRPIRICDRRQQCCLPSGPRSSFSKSISEAADDKTRLAGVLAAGFRLTLPPANKPIDASLPLAPWPEEAIYKVRYFDETVDLRTLGRLGMFTVAEHWKAGKHTAEQESLFALLRERLADSSDRVRLQAAHFLFLLDDPRTEPLIRDLRKSTERSRVASAPLKSLGRVWGIGPFADGPRGMASVLPPETGRSDLSATYRIREPRRSAGKSCRTIICSISARRSAYPRTRRTTPFAASKRPSRSR